MITFQPPSFRMAQVPAAQLLPSVPPPSPDVLSMNYSGPAGFVETAAVLAVSASASWIGLRTALGTDRNPYVKAAGWVGGVGAALIGLLYLGGKSGISGYIGLPVVRVAPY